MVFQLRAPLLTRVGGLLYHEDPIAASDAIVVLSGGRLDRVVEAADLFAAGYAPVVVLTRTPEEPLVVALQARGLDVPTSLESQMAYLAALDVPRDATTVLQPVVDSTQTEAELIVEWAETREIEQLIVVTSGFSYLARTVCLRPGAAGPLDGGADSAQHRLRVRSGDMVAWPRVSRPGPVRARETRLLPHHVSAASDTLAVCGASRWRTTATTVAALVGSTLP